MCSKVHSHDTKQLSHLPMYFIDNIAYSGIYYTEIDKRQYGVLRWRYPGGVKAAEQNVVAY